MNFFETGIRNFPCTGGYRYIQIDSEGNVHPCDAVPKEFTFGNTREHDLSDMWFSDKASLLRKKLKESAICRKCPNHCDVFSVVREEFFDFFSFMMSHPQLLLGTLKRYFQ